MDPERLCSERNRFVHRIYLSSLHYDTRSSTMKKLLITLLLLAVFVLTGCSAILNGSQVIKGSGNVTSEDRSVSGFTSISLEGSADVQVVLGESEGLTIEAEDNILPVIETVVQ